MGNFILAVIMLSALIIFTGVNSFYICDVCDDIIELTDQSKFQEAVSLWEANSDYISFFVKDSDIDDLVKGLPVIPKEFQPKLKLINKKPILPSEKELTENSRSRSAKLRIVERI